MTSEATRWTIIRGAAAGRAEDREAFARNYAPVIRASLGARWRGSPRLADLDDAAQEVFVACFRADGPLARADKTRTGGFRAYLYGIVRNVARDFEKRGMRRRERAAGSRLDLDGFEGDEERLAEAFDRAWAQAMVRQAGARQAEAAHGDERAELRVEVLQLRFGEDLPVREIARRKGLPAPRIHEAYRAARREFFGFLREVVGEHHGGTPAEVRAECERLLEYLG